MSYEKHGHARVGAHSRTYICWLNMKARCLKPTNRDFHNYGGRGIAICQRWRDSFSNFLADMGELPDGLTIERIDNDGNYEPGNCRWATYLEQGANTRKAKNISSDGLRMPQIRWSLKLSSNKELVRRRIEMGWKPEDAVTTPPLKAGATREPRNNRGANGRFVPCQ